MTILITGGSGKTSSVLAKRLQAANLPILVASRAGKAPEPFKAVVFNWLDPATFENPFIADPSIDRVYIVVPMFGPETAHVNTFIDFARSKGVKRFVLLSASQIEAGQLPLGQIHQYLIDSGVEYAVLRPTWFQQNFGASLLTSIRDHNQTFSASQNGRLAFVSTEDIAEAAFQALTAEPSLNKDLLVFGPELLSHDEAATLLSEAVGRKITHVKHTVEEMRNIYASYGLPEEYASVLSSMEGKIADGVEEELFNVSDEKKFVGKRALGAYIKENREQWIN